MKDIVDQSTGTPSKLANLFRDDSAQQNVRAASDPVVKT